MKLVSMVGDQPTGPLEVLEYLIRKGYEPKELVLTATKSYVKTMEIVELAILLGMRSVIPTSFLVRRVILPKDEPENKVEFEDIIGIIDNNVDPGDFVDVSSAPRVPAIAATLVARRKHADLAYVPQLEEAQRVKEATEKLKQMDLAKEIATVKAGGEASQEVVKLLEQVVLKKPRVIIIPP
jgi:hypothetical protein